MLNVNIRTTKKEGEAPLLTYIRIGNKNHVINLHLMVDIKIWNEVASSKKKLQIFLDKNDYTARLLKIEFGIKELKRQGAYTKENVELLIQDIVLKDLRKKVLEEEKLGKEIRDREKKSIKNYVINFIDQMESGEARNNKGELYGKQTIKAWKQFKRIFIEFYDKNPFTWEEIDKSTINKFMSYLEKCKYMKKTRNKYLTTLRQVIGDAEKVNLHTNHIAKELIKKPQVKESDKSKEIYLTKDEIEELYNMELDGLEERVRDLFLIGCYTAQRFSDFSKIKEDCIGTTAKGIRVIRMEQKKTEATVVIPIMDSKLEVLLKKYDYNVPPITDQVMNRTIKKIAERLSETVPSLGKKEKTVLKKQEVLAEENKKCTFERDKNGNVVKPRYQLISTHTARRSAITNMYLSGKYTIPQMMSVSGHKDEKTFRSYVKLSGDEMEEGVAGSIEDGMF